MTGGLDIKLDWPPRELHPNARPHHMQRSKAAKAYRERSFYLTHAAIPLVPGFFKRTEGEVLLTVAYYPPDKRKRDLDGMFAASKAGFDGIADALQVNDYRFAFTIRRAEPVKGGLVVVSIGGDA